MEKLKINWRVVNDEDYYISKDQYRKEVVNPAVYVARKDFLRKKYQENIVERRATQKEYDKKHKTEKREYYLQNKERIKERNKEYRLKHKDQYRYYAWQNRVRNKMKKTEEKLYSTTKPKVMCIIGESGVGKTEASLYLQKTFKDCNLLVSYTTRNKRVGEENGREHYFVTPDDKPNKEDMLAYTVFGNNEYWTLKSDIRKHKITVYVIDEDGYRWLKDKYKDDYQLFAVRIIRDVNKREGVTPERIERDKARVPLCVKWFRTIQNNGSIEGLFKKINKAFKDIQNK